MFTEFAKGLISKLPKRSSVIILDNLPIHHAHAVRDLFKESHSQIIFLPPYSCNLNSIEWLWSLVKGRWRHNLTKNYDHAMKEDEVLNRIK